MIVPLYARYSSDNQRTESIVAQLRACREYCQRYGYTIIKEYADEAMTGSTSSKKGGLEHRYYRCPKKTRLVERYRREMKTGKAPNLKGTIAAFVDKITVSDSNITIRYRFEPTLSQIDKFDLYGALGGSRTHAFSSGG